MSFDPQAGLSGTDTLGGFSNASIGAVEGGRKSASDAALQASALRDRTTQTLQSATGVSLDDEMSKMLDLEHAYGASAKLISAIDGMFSTLVQSIQ